MRTQEMLNSLPDYSLGYLKALRSDMRKAESAGDHVLASDLKAEGRGYIRCLVGCGVIDNFRTLWCWFTL